MLRKIRRPRLLAAYMPVPAAITTGYMVWKAGEMGIALQPTLMWTGTFAGFAACAALAGMGAYFMVHGYRHTCEGKGEVTEC